MIVLVPRLWLKDNESAYFTDRTGNTGANDTAYGQDTNIEQSDVVAIRLKTGNYTTVTNPAVPPDGVFVQYTEYLKIDGDSEVINGKTFTVGDFFVPQDADLETLQTDSWNTTGYYVYPFLATWLPSTGQAPMIIGVSQFGQSGDDIEDNEYIFEYEIYYDTQTGTVAAVEGQTYIVLTGSLTYDGNTYYAGETFMGVDTGNIVAGANTFALLYASQTGYAPLVYSIFERINDLIEAQIGKNSQNLIDSVYTKILQIRAELEALQYSSDNNNVSLLYAYNTIQTISATLNGLL